MDVLKPSPALLMKLGSLIIHYQEFISLDGHDLDKRTIDSLLKDEEVVTWMKQMDDNAFLPKKRNNL